MLLGVFGQQCCVRLHGTLFTKKLENLSVQKWNEERNKILRDRKSKLETLCSSKSKLETLCSSIKANYGFENYIDITKDTYSRKLLTQLRVSAHKVPKISPEKNM